MNVELIKNFYEILFIYILAVLWIEPSASFMPASDLPLEICLQDFAFRLFFMYDVELLCSNWLKTVILLPLLPE